MQHGLYKKNWFNIYVLKLIIFTKPSNKRISTNYALDIERRATCGFCY